MGEHKLQPEIIVTADGSHSLYLSGIDETYHSRHGALQESKYVFIERGLKTAFQREKIHLLEVGFGTGLNALLTAQAARENRKPVVYHTLETFPLSLELMRAIRSEATTGRDNDALFMQLHEAAWNEEVEIHPFFRLKKIRSSLQEFEGEFCFYNLIYYDAFGPRAQPEMWIPELFRKLAAMTAQEGILVTYCAKGQVRRDLEAAGFRMERLPGPPGKREMMRGIRE